MVNTCVNCSPHPYPVGGREGRALSQHCRGPCCDVAGLCSWDLPALLRLNLQGKKEARQTSQILVGIHLSSTVPLLFRGMWLCHRVTFVTALWVVQSYFVSISQHTSGALRNKCWPLAASEKIESWLWRSQMSPWVQQNRIMELARILEVFSSELLTFQMRKRMHGGVIVYPISLLCHFFFFFYKMEFSSPPSKY